jgi:Xaa-Pro aminopeptidase
MNIRERVSELRRLMKEKNIDAYIIPSCDAHQSEYVAEHWKSRTWISGFTGSAGTVVVAKNEAGLWTDGRYYIQAEKQLEGSGIKLFKMREPNVPSTTEWIFSTLDEGSCVGFDGKVFSAASVKNMKETFSKKKLSINSEYDLIDLIWNDRPEVPMNKIYIHEVKYSGKSRNEKIKEVRKYMKEEGANHYLLASLDDIAWLFNIRGNDVSNNPVAISYALISEKEVYIFIDNRKVSNGVRKELEQEGIILKEYENIQQYLKALDDNDKVLFDANKTNIWLYNSLPENCETINKRNITTKLKAIKNDIEIENLRRCQTRDGAAMVKFLYWLDNTVGKEKVTEISATDKLIGFRAEQELYMASSFDYIAGYKEHAAMMHYKATPDSDYELKREGMFLVDSGGQYLDGTTDITRTIVLGKLSEEEKFDFTLTLKGHIALNKAKFLYGTRGIQLDILARRPLWEHGIDYKCGTGHGVGFLLNVHEGPQSISPHLLDVKIEKGMVTTNEPGVYKEGKHGIRIENTTLAVEDQQTEFGQFMKFEVISYCPIDLEAINVDMLTKEEKEWLNDYHKDVYEKLSPYLNEEEKVWLKNETREI